MASPEAPTSSQEIEKAVPKEQSSSAIDLIKRDRDSRPDRQERKRLKREQKAKRKREKEQARQREKDQSRQRKDEQRRKREKEQRDKEQSRQRTRNPAIAGPRRGGGNIGQPPPSGGTKRGVVNGGDWQVSPDSYGNSPGKGYDGINLDIRCREADRTHEDCPEYVRKFEGRDAEGFESFQGRAGRGTNAGSNLRARRGLPVTESLQERLNNSTNFNSSINGFGTQTGINAQTPPGDPGGRVRDLFTVQPDDNSGVQQGAPIEAGSNPENASDPNAWILKEPN